MYDVMYDESSVSQEKQFSEGTKTIFMADHDWLNFHRWYNNFV